MLIRCKLKFRYNWDAIIIQQEQYTFRRFGAHIGCFNANSNFEEFLARATVGTSLYVLGLSVRLSVGQCVRLYFSKLTLGDFEIM